MSFMFNPHLYDDMSAINHLALSQETAKSIVCGNKQIADYLSTIVDKYMSDEKNCCIIAMDGYISAQLEQIINLLSQEFASKKIEFAAYDISAVYKPAEVLEDQLKEYLPEDRVTDPVLLFGKLFGGRYEDVFDTERYEDLINHILNEKKRMGKGKKVIIVYGCGAGEARARICYDYIAYFDVTPKQVALRAKNGLMKNLGDTHARPFKEMMRRAYYVDFEIAYRLRGEMIRNGEIDFYIISDNPADMRLIPKKALDEILSSLAMTPFRCKPVYIEGVWGGQYIKKMRKLPDAMRNVAWAFDLIPLEVSILAEVNGLVIEFPYFTFVQKEGKTIMGERCVKRFDGYFPIRFNYDDTYHSSGNMSIQVHPGEAYCKNNFNELGRQDESYYVVATGHGAKTYMGLNKGADADEFISEAKRSEKVHSKVEYEKYINSVPSVPGMQFLIPAGTVHASGRNQLILEIGSLTVGSYTYKLYDYLRLDLDGIPRPIHTYHGERALEKSRTTPWVKDNLVRQPILVRKGQGWAEYIVGEHDLLYFSLRRLEFENEIEDDTNGKFHVLTLVDGEKVMVQSFDYPERCFYQNYLDVVVVPASVGRYIVKNLGNQPVVLHKTMLKDGFDEE